MNAGFKVGQWLHIGLDDVENKNAFLRLSYIKFIGIFVEHSNFIYIYIYLFIFFIL